VSESKKIAAFGSSYRDMHSKVGAAEGCDLLIFDQKSFSGSSLSADSCSRNAST
jgi:hypothetical protein